MIHLPMLVTHMVLREKNQRGSEQQVYDDDNGDDGEDV